MIIYPINTEAFYFKDLTQEIQNKIINDKITSILINLDSKKYKKYKDIIESTKLSSSPLNYREFLREFNLDDIINDIIGEKRLFDSYGNMFNIIYRNNNHYLYLTKTTFIPVKILNTKVYNAFFSDSSNELPTVFMTQIKACNQDTAIDFASNKFSELLKPIPKSEIFVCEAE